MVGPNGAGKTTTLRMATGLLRPDGGRVLVEGVDVWRHPVEVKARIGVLPEELQLFDRLTGRELLTYNGLLRDMSAVEVETRTDDLLRVLGLREAADELVVDYSHGMRKKMALAAALIHAPRVLFLDEPFEAVDPLSSRTIRGVLDQFTTAGGTVIFSSHVMDEVERLCDRVAILHEGRVVAEGRLAEVKGEGSLEDAFVSIVGAKEAPESLEWFSSSSG
jgi:ABC-2 type transport system ATP-binding protein